MAGLFVFVRRHDGGFDRDVAGDERGKSVTRGGGVEFVEQGGVADSPVLDHLGKAFAVFAVGQGGQCVGVGQHKVRLMERADEIFSRPGIDPGLASDRAVDLGHDGRGDLHQRDSPLVNGSNEAREVADHAAAQGDDKGTAVESRLNHAVAEAFGRGEAL